MKSSFVFPLLLLALAGHSAEAQSPGAFIQIGSMSTWRVFHTATLLNDGRVLIAGGVADTTLSSAELYDPATRSFTPTGSMGTPRYAHTATLLPNGKVLIAGGVTTTSSPYLTSMELYDPATGTFRPAGNMTIGRAFHAATLLNNGKVLLIGGGSRVAEQYNPDTGSLTPTGSTTEGEGRQWATLLANGTVLHAPIAGGSNSNGEGGADLYDPTSGVFRPTGDGASLAVSGLYVLTQNLLANGKVLVTSGAPECDYPSADALIYDPVAESFSATGGMVRGRCMHTGTTLSDGTVLISGAARNCADFPPPEVYDPTSGRFNQAGAMIVASRYVHTATLLKDGSVLMAGGLGVNSSPCGNSYPALAELYIPHSVAPPPVLLSLSGDMQGSGAILHAATQQVVSPDNPAVAGEALEIFGTGLIDGAVIPPQLAIGGLMGEVLYFGNAPGYPGLNQINVRAPNGIGAGSAVPVRLNYLNRPSNEVTLAVR
jgi:hypothetical protein